MRTVRACAAVVKINTSLNCIIRECRPRNPVGRPSVRARPPPPAPLPGIRYRGREARIKGTPVVRRRFGEKEKGKKEKGE